jgi:hypothetical protein
MKEYEHINHCRSCDAEIVFLRTRNRKIIPVNADKVQHDDYYFDPSRHTAHFATCPDADDFRR